MHATTDTRTFTADLTGHVVTPTVQAHQRSLPGGHGGLVYPSTDATVRLDLSAAVRADFPDAVPGALGAVQVTIDTRALKALADACYEALYAPEGGRGVVGDPRGMTRLPLARGGRMTAHTYRKETQP